MEEAVATAERPEVEEENESSEQEEQAKKPPRGDVVVLGLWLTEASRERLQDALGAEITDDQGRAEECALVAVSTRSPRARILPIVRNLRSTNRPIGIVCHTGGEQIALEIMRAGGTGVVAEGNESALQRFLEDDAGEEESLVTTYEQRVGSARGAEASNSVRDRVTGLPSGPAFDLRLTELSQSGSLVRVGFLRVANFNEVTAGLGREGIDVLRRRLASLYQGLTVRHGAELFALSPADFAFLARDLTAASAQEFGRSLIEVSEAFAPGGTLPMMLAVGHAGPELSSDLELLRELAERAVAAAASQEGAAVVNAEDLSSSLVSATELDIAMRMVTYLSDYDGYAGSHSGRVADYASELGRQMGFEGRELMRVRLAALLHDVGKVGLPPEAMQASEELEGYSLEAYQSHSERGARYVKLTAGREVCDAIHSHHENWDGSGFPQKLSGEQIPMIARIISVANAFDQLTTVPTENGVALTRKESLAKIAEDAGRRFDPVLIEAAQVAFGR